MQAFEISSERKFLLTHVRLGIVFGEWSGSLHYRCGAKEYREEVPFAAASGKRNRHRLTAEGVHAHMELVMTADEVARINGVLRNDSAEDLILDNLTLAIDDFNPGGSLDRYSFFKNGYQSWTATQSYSPEGREMTPIIHPMNIMQDNLRNLPTKKRGEFTSDMFAVIANLDKRASVLIGQGKDFKQFLYVRGIFSQKGEVPILELVYDFGGTVIEAGSTMKLDEMVFVADDSPNEVQDIYFEMIKPRVKSQQLPTGWCSWYYYFTKINQKEIFENAAVAGERNPGWKYFVLDDGYNTAIGDWLSVNRKFPDGLKAVAEKVQSAGMVPGLWLAPFIARRNSQLYREHREWFLKDERGKPVLAGWNPNWGLGGNFYGLDVTHPGFQEYLREVINTAVHEWGFRYLKLDFVYGASLYGSAFDQTITPSERLRRGLAMVRETAGKNVFILGCGCPISAGIGLVDAMRIGPDVAPYWFATYRYHLSRDPHALCTKFAIRSILNRCPMHRKLWINDPDCLLIRDRETRLNREERMSLANAMIITGGMYLISDKLSALPPHIWELVNQVDRLIHLCDGGRVWPLDYMEREIPELVYNSKGYLAVFNFSNRTVYKRIPYQYYLGDLLDEDVRLKDVWDESVFIVSEGSIDIGEMAPHSSKLLRVE